MQKTTDQLMNEIQNSHEIEKFLENNNGEFTEEDKLIALCFGMMLDIDETDDLLKYAGYNPLYARNKRDSIIIFAISN